MIPLRQRRITSSKPNKPSISFDTLIENYTENVQLREKLKYHLEYYHIQKLNVNPKQLNKEKI